MPALIKTANIVRCQDENGDQVFALSKILFKGSFSSLALDAVEDDAALRHRLTELQGAFSAHQHMMSIFGEKSPLSFV